MAHRNLPPVVQGPDAKKHRYKHLLNTTRPSASEWYPRLYLGWDFNRCLDVYCYFFQKRSDREMTISWAIHPLGPPFLGQKDPIDFSHVLKLSKIQCDDAFSTDLKEAVVGKLFTKYISQERFKYDTPTFELEILSMEEILLMWEKGELDANDEDAMKTVKLAIKEMFGLDVKDVKVEFLTRIIKLGTPLFETNIWRAQLCFGSRPSIESEEKQSLKRKHAEDTPSSISFNKNSSQNLKHAEIPLSPALKMNVLVAQWLRLEADMDEEVNQRLIQEWLKSTYELDASLDDIKQITKNAKDSKPPKSPLETSTFRGMIAVARHELTSSLMNPFRPRSKTASSQILFPEVKMEQ